MTVDTGGSLPLREDDPDGCPLCGVSLLGEPIPEASRHHYGSSTHFRREMGVETDGYDGVLYWVCPDCHGAWPRFTNTRLPAGAVPDRLTRLGLEAVAAHTAQVALLSDATEVERTLTTHAEQIEGAIEGVGLAWTGWTVDSRTGAWLVLLVDTTGFDWAGTTFEQARDLVRDITGLPVVLVGENSPSAQMLGEPTPPPSVRS